MSSYHKTTKEKKTKPFPCQSCVHGKLIKLELSFLKSIFGIILGENFVMGGYYLKKPFLAKVCVHGK
jgi:hypothetical protein